MKNLCVIFLVLSAFVIVSFSSCRKLDGKTVPVDSLKVGLIAYYPFNGNAADSTGAGNNATVYNAILTGNRFGVPNKAYTFDGLTSYMVVKDTKALRLDSTDFSINVWINLANYNYSYGTEVLVKRNAGTAQGWDYGITGVANLSNNIPFGVTSYQVSGGSDPVAKGNKQVSLNQWHMLTTVYYFKQKTLLYYIDGLPDDITYNIPTPSANITANLTIGQDSQTAINTNYFLNGKLDDIRIYGRALSAGSVQKLYNLTY